MTSKAVLLLEDGTLFEGESAGARGETLGEVVFNTSMTGYQEILTDPSYKGQIVTMTFPLIGNYGTNEQDVESCGPHAAGFIVRELSPTASSWRSAKTLSDYLIERQIVSATGIDTRALTRKVRTKGAMNGILSSIDFNKDSLAKKLAAAPSMQGLDLVKDVTEIDKNFAEGLPAGKFRVAVIDFGVKRNILRILSAKNCSLRIFSPGTKKEEIDAFKPHGLFLTNGPGDPAAVMYGARLVKKYIGILPIFGICFGHQIVGLAAGARTYKLKFGHRGANHPVKNLKTGLVEITAQNHGFAVDASTLPNNVEVSHINLNDMTVEGLSFKDAPVYSVQYHPEASAGPHDSMYLFDQFIKNMTRGI